MSTQTTHLKLDLRESSDIFNPLSTNANFESLDNIIYEIQNKGGVPTYTTTASANLLKLSENPTPNSTVFKFVAAGDANTWTFSETINDIVALDGTKKTVKGGNMYVAWVNSTNAMVVIAWPDVVNAQTFDGKGPNDWATAAQLQAVNQSAANATQTAQAAATVANNALKVANEAGFKPELIFSGDESVVQDDTYVYNLTKSLSNYSQLYIVFNPGFAQDFNEKHRAAMLVPVPSAGEQISLSAFSRYRSGSTSFRSGSGFRSIKRTSDTLLTTESTYYSDTMPYSVMAVVAIYGIK